MKIASEKGDFDLRKAAELESWQWNGRREGEKSGSYIALALKRLANLKIVLNTATYYHEDMAYV
jgi:hypothetical protein